MASQWKRLVRFVPKSDLSKVLIGEPNDENVDVGLALRNGEEVVVTVFAGASVLAPGQRSDRTEVIDRVLSPVTRDEAGPIRCVGLNYHQHAKEMKMELPSVPSIFLKPQFALADPWPAKSIIPRQSFEHDAADYEVELAIVIGKLCKNVSEKDALDYVLGYTAANDISSRHAQMQQSQWCYSKGFDGSCPLGPCLVSQHVMPDASKFRVRSIGHNGEILQSGETSDFIFSVSQMVSFISQSTTLPAGTVIITGTPPGVGFAKTPPYSLKAGEELRVEISPYIGSLVSAFENET